MATSEAVESVAGARRSSGRAALRVWPTLLAAALAAMPGAATAVPPLPPLVTLTAGPKLLQLSWPNVGGATTYKVMLDATGTGTFKQVAFLVAPVFGPVVWSASIAVHKKDWNTATYQVQACNKLCTPSASISVAGAMLTAIGYVKASNTGGDATNTGGGDAFGRVVAMSADGNTAAVGARYESSDAKGVDGNQASDLLTASGAVYVFARQNLVWSQQAYLKAPNSAYAALFGTALSLSADGNRLAIGAPAHAAGPTGPGMTYVFVRTGTTWAYEQDLAASNPESLDAFGQAVALSGDGYTLAVGAPNEASSASGLNGDQTSNAMPSAGAVYVFKRTSGIWAQQAYVKAQNPTQDAIFGSTVSLADDGNALAIGAPGAVSLPGAVSVYVRSGTLWSWQTTLAGAAPVAGDYFGVAVSLAGDGNTLGVGASGETAGTGAAYVFTRSGVAWSQQARLLASNAEAGDTFGYALALSSDGLWLAVGAPWEDSKATGIDGDQLSNLSSNAGAVYVFQSSGGVWTQDAYVKASNTGSSDSFGWSVGLGSHGDQLIVGAPGEDGQSIGVASGSAATNDSAYGAGAAYLY